MDPCKRCLVVAACQDNCEKRINYVKRRINIIDKIIISASMLLIMAIMGSLGMSAYADLNAGYNIKVVLYVKDVNWKFVTVITVSSACFFGLVKMFLDRHKNYLKSLIGEEERDLSL